MHVVVLMAFVVALTLADLAPVVASRWLVAPALAVYLAGAVAMGAFRTALSLRAMDRRADLPGSSLRRHNVLALIGQGWLVLGLGGVILVGYGRWVLDDLLLGHVPLLGEVVILIPFVVALLLSWLLEYPLYRAIRGRIAQQQILTGLRARAAWTLREYLGYNTRHHLLFVAVPVGLILLLTDSLGLAASYLPEPADSAVAMGGAMVCAAGVFLCAPLLIVRIWRTARLPAGKLRKDLQRLCRDMKLTYRDLLVWRSGGLIANAGVMGLIGPVRYVLLSDALLEQMPDREIQSIFAHEAGHIRSHHLFYALLFAVSSVTLCSAGGELTAVALSMEWWVGQVTTLGLLAVAWAVGFGWISRRFERQSDVIAAWTSCPAGASASGRVMPEGAAVFARALERVAELNGISARQWNWRHGSIAARVAYVLWLGSTGGTRHEVDRVVRRIKIALWISAGAGAAVIAARLVWGV